MSHFTAVGDVPAPIIKLGPANQTLPLSTVALLPCEATGNPLPKIRWFVNSTPVNIRNPRFLILDSGTLQIDGKFFVTYKFVLLIVFS